MKKIVSLLLIMMMCAVLFIPALSVFADGEETAADAAVTETAAAEDTAAAATDAAAEEEHDHDHDHEAEESTGVSTVSNIIGIVVAVIIAAAFVVLVIWFVPKNSAPKKK